MRTLLLLRHAKAEPESNGQGDHSRDLTHRGRRDAEQVGHWLKKQALVPDLVVSSTAKRARATAELVAKSAGVEAAVQLRDDLYLARPDAYINVLRGCPDDEATVLLVGHNPGIEDLLTQLAGAEKSMKTAAIAHIRFPVLHWSDISPAAAALIEEWHPPHD